MSTHLEEAIRCRHLALLLAVGLAVAPTAACRADVDGVWEGTIGADQARLSLDQAGSVIEGEACIDRVCAEIDDGEIVEGDLTIEFGRSTCGVGNTLIDAFVEGSSMSGVAYAQDCDCASEGRECVLSVELDRAN